MEDINVTLGITEKPDQVNLSSFGQYSGSGWVASSTKVFWAVIAISVGGVFSTIYDSVSWIPIMIQSVLSFMGNGDASPTQSIFYWIGILLKVSVIVGYVFYFIGLTEFAQAQRLPNTVRNVYKVRSAVILLLITSIINFLFSFMRSIPLLGIFFGLIMFILFLVGYFKLRNAYGALMDSEEFNGEAKLGAQKLRNAASYRINLLLLPFFVFLGALLLFAMMGPEMLMFNSAAGAVTLVIAIIPVLLAIIWTICAYFWPMIGWYKIKSAGPADLMITIQDAEEVASENIDAPANEANDTMQNEVDQTLFGGFDTQATINKAKAMTVEKEQVKAMASKTNDWLKVHKKPASYAAGAMAALIIAAIALPKIFTPTPSEILGMKVPKWEKFLLVASDGNLIYKSADESSAHLLTCVYDMDYEGIVGHKWSDGKWKKEYEKEEYNTYDATPISGWEIFPIIEEKGEWYKIHLAGYEDETTGQYGYMKKEAGEIRAALPITQEILYKLNKSYSSHSVFYEDAFDEYSFHKVLDIDYPTFIQKDKHEFCIRYFQDDSRGDIESRGEVGFMANNKFLIYPSQSNFDANATLDGEAIKEQGIMYYINMVKTDNPAYENIYVYLGDDTENLFQIQYKLK